MTRRTFGESVIKSLHDALFLAKLAQTSTIAAS